MNIGDFSTHIESSLYQSTDPGRAYPSPWVAKQLYYVVSEMDFEVWKDSTAHPQGLKKRAILTGLKAAWMEPLSLDEESGEGERSYRGNTRSVEANNLRTLLVDHEQEDMLDAIEMNAVVHDLLKELREHDPRMYDVIWLRFGFHDGVCWTLQKIADEYGITRERIRQLEAMALERIGTIVLQRTLIHRIAEQGGAPRERLQRSPLKSGVVLVARPDDLDLRTSFPGTEIPKKLKIYAKTFHGWIQFSSFPRPTRIDGTDYWKLGDVVDWAFRHDRIRFR